MSAALDLFGKPEPLEYPDSPGHRGVETSVAAAEAVAPNLARLQQLALRAIEARGRFGLTTDELAETLGVNRYSIQPRTSELRRKRLIVDSGLRRRNGTGKTAIVWVAPEYERSAA